MVGDLQRTRAWRCLHTQRRRHIKLIVRDRGLCGQRRGGGEGVRPPGAPSRAAIATQLAPATYRCTWRLAVGAGRPLASKWRQPRAGGGGWLGGALVLVGKIWRGGCTGSGALKGRSRELPRWHFAWGCPAAPPGIPSAADSTACSPENAAWLLGPCAGRARPSLALERPFESLVRPHVTGSPWRTTRTLSGRR